MVPTMPDLGALSPYSEGSRLEAAIVTYAVGCMLEKKNKMKLVMCHVGCPRNLMNLPFAPSCRKSKSIKVESEGTEALAVLHRLSLCLWIQRRLQGILTCQQKTKDQNCLTGWQQPSSFQLSSDAELSRLQQAVKGGRGISNPSNIKVSQSDEFDCTSNILLRIF